MTAVQSVPGAAGAAGSGAAGTDAWAWAPSNGFAASASITDWGPVWSAMIAAGIHNIILPEHQFPWSTMIVANGIAAHVVFQGAQGRGAYGGTVYEHIGTRMIYKGGASPTVTHADGAMTSGSAVLTSATGPWTNGGGASNIWHVGQPITVVGAGAGGTSLVSQIISRQSATQVTLADAAGTTVSGASYTYTDWARAINALGSSGIEFRDLKLTYDNPAFDGILADMRSDSNQWSGRGRFSNCIVGGETIDLSNASTTAASCVRAYALVHLSGHGENFLAEGTSFQGAKAAIRGMYGNNADDAVFTECLFNTCVEACVTNPGRFWSFYKCRSQGSGLGGPRMGAIFKGDGEHSIQSVLRLNDFSAWDFGQDSSTTGASITSGTTTLTISGWSFLTTYTEDIFWKDRIVHVVGAGAGGANLNTRIVKRLSTTTVQVADAAATTVANGGWMVGDGGFMYQPAGFNWDVKIDGLMTWLCPSPEFELLGTGKIHAEDWWTNRGYRADLPGQYEYMRFNSNPAGGNKFQIDLENMPFGSGNALLGIDGAIVNYAGHDILRIKDAPFALNFERLDTNRHTSLLSAHPNQGGTPAAAAHAGQTLSNISVWGNDEVGQVFFDTGAGGATAGQLLDVTFARSWPSLYTSIGNSGQGNYTIHLTPVEFSDGVSRGSNSAKATAYAKCDNANNNGWTLGIANAVAGAQSLGWSYRIVRT